MDPGELELPDPCQPCCGLMQECWDAAGVSTTTAAAPQVPDADRVPLPR